MLGVPSAAEDAVQEIFYKIWNKARDFREESSFQTWAFSVAKHYLIDQKRKDQREKLRFVDFQKDLHGFEAYQNELGLTPAEETLYIEQIKVGCTTAMLQCLTPRDRLVFILGNLFAMAGQEAAVICGMKEAAYRKALSRSRKCIESFMKRNCGLMNPRAECQCRKRLKIAFDRGRIQPRDMDAVEKTKPFRDLHHQMDHMDRLAQIYGEHPYYEDLEGLTRFLAESG